MERILIIKTGALGDVLRSTSLLPGIHKRWPGAEVSWVTAHGAEPLLQGHKMVERVIAIDPAECADSLPDLAACAPDRIFSLDDDPELCALAAALQEESDANLVGACLNDAGEPAYTPDAECWFGMGLLSREGLQKADERKLANRRTHPDLLAEVIGVEPGRPALNLPAADLDSAARLLDELAPASAGLRIGLNTGAGGRWHTKAMRPEEVTRLVALLHEKLGAAALPGVQFLFLGGPGEIERNQGLLSLSRSATPAARLIDVGCEHSLGTFAALVGGLDLLVASDSLALHLAVAQERKTVAFFAPTSPHEIELYGLGEKVISSASDAGNYACDTDNSTITGERVAAAVLRQLS